MCELECWVPGTGFEIVGRKRCLYSDRQSPHGDRAKGNYTIGRMMRIRKLHDPISSVETAAKGEVERQAVLNASASCLNKVAFDVQGAALGNQ